MPKIILVSAQKGGSGKSTLTFNLAQNISQSAKVAVIDFDPQGSLIQLKDVVTDFDIIPYQQNVNNILNLEYDIVFIDTSPYLSHELPKLIDIASLVIIPTKIGVLDVLSMKNTISLIENQNGLIKSMIVLNMVKANTTLTLDVLIELEKFKTNVAKTHISELVSFTRSVLLKGVVSDRKAQRQIDNLTREVLTAII